MNPMGRVKMIQLDTASNNSTFPAWNLYTNISSFMVIIRIDFCHKPNSTTKQT